MTSKNKANSAQTFSGLMLNAGFSTIQTTQTGTGKNVLTLGADNAIKTTTGNVNNILGGWATYQSGTATPISAYAANDGTGNIIAYTGYTPQAAGAIANDATKNYQVQTNGTVALTTPNGATTDINTLSLSSAATGVSTITVGTAGTGSTGIFRGGATGGIHGGKRDGRTGHWERQ